MRIKDTLTQKLADPTLAQNHGTLTPTRTNTFNPTKPIQPLLAPPSTSSATHPRTILAKAIANDYVTELDLVLDLFQQITRNTMGKRVRRGIEKQIKAIGFRWVCIAVTEAGSSHKKLGVSLTDRFFAICEEMPNRITADEDRRLARLEAEELKREAEMEARQEKLEHIRDGKPECTNKGGDAWDVLFLDENIQSMMAR